jgi:hypothetical protein
MSPELKKYIELETRVQECSKAGDEFLADHIRDIMDRVWLSLSEEDHAFLDSRTDSPPETIKE